MRTRFVVLAAVLSALVAVAAPGVAGAAPRHNRGLTIAATPNPINAGEGVFIYGQLNGANNANQLIVLYHRINPRRGFTVIQTARTDGFGFYHFVRADGIVMTNREWFVRGPGGTHSRTVHERVAALVSLASNTTDTVTGAPILFSGHVTPTHPFERVKLQQQDATNGNGWHTIATGFTGGGSNFFIPHRWRVPGVYTLRALFGPDARNVAGVSDTVTVTVEQKQNPTFTINSSSPIIPAGQSATISGVLYQPGSTTPLGSTEVTLFARTASSPFHAVATKPTGTDGSYSFTDTPTHNTVYEVITTLKPRRHTALLFEGVQDVVSTPVGSSTATVGGTVTFTGTVSPDHTGHLIYLQMLGPDGRWHIVDAGVLGTGSAYSFTPTFGQPGTFQLRARIFGGPENVGGASQAVTVTVSGVAASLPPAS
jgi:hypothetical protein